MGIGPVEYMVVAFPGNQFKGEIVPALKEQVDAGTIRIIDLAFVIKDADGNVAALEVEDLDSEVGAAFSEMLGSESGGLLNDEDMHGRRRGARAEQLGGVCSCGRTSGPTKIADAIVKAGGELWDLERVPARCRRSGRRVRGVMTERRGEPTMRRRGPGLVGVAATYRGGRRDGDRGVGADGATSAAEVRAQDAAASSRLRPSKVSRSSTAAGGSAAPAKTTRTTRSRSSRSCMIRER